VGGFGKADDRDNRFEIEHEVKSNRRRKLVINQRPKVEVELRKCPSEDRTVWMAGEEHAVACESTHALDYGIWFWEDECWRPGRSGLVTVKRMDSPVNTGRS
jgi:hypothetical protein